jgi:hypothetical protein
MTVTLLEVLAAAKKHAAALPGELAGYLLLATADQVAAAPRCPALQDVALDEDGGVRVVGGAAASDTQAERRLRELFGFTLGHSAPVTAALTRVAQRGTSGSVRGLAQELEAALIPLNRGASRRALSRLCRETMRAVARGELADLAPLAAEAEGRAQPSAPPQRDPIHGAPADVAQAPPPLAVAAAPELASEAEARSTADPAETSAPEASVPLAAPPGVAPCARSETPDVPHAAEGTTLEALLAAASPPPPDSSAAPTPVLRVASSTETPSPSSVSDASTRPEPVIVRASQRPGPPSVVADASLTPPLGSLAAPECVPVEVARELPEVALVVGENTERMPDVEALLELEPPPAAGPQLAEAALVPQHAEHWPCEGFIAWESCAPPAVAHTARVAAVDEEALAVDAAWDDVAREVERAFDTIQGAGQPAHEHAPLLAPCSVLALDSLTLTQPGGIVAELPLPPTAAKAPSSAPAPAWAPARFLPRKSDVDALLRGFCVADSRDERELCRKLCEIAGVEASASV